MLISMLWWCSLIIYKYRMLNNLFVALGWESFFFIVFVCFSLSRLCIERMCRVHMPHDSFIRWHHRSAAVQKPIFCLSGLRLLHSVSFYAWLYIFCLECISLSFWKFDFFQQPFPWTHTNPNTRTHTDGDTLSIHDPQPLDPTAPCRCYHFSIRPHSWPADPVLGVWQCWGLMLMTSSFTMSPLPPLDLLSIVWLTVSGLVLAEDGAGAAHSLCKWWKRVRELGWKCRPCLGACAGRWANRKAPFSPDSNFCDLCR